MSDTKTIYNPAWKHRVGTKMYDDNNDIMIVTKNILGIRRWVKIKKKNVFNIRKFEINRNNSIITPKPNEYITLCLTKDGYMHLILSSRYVKDANGICISKHLSKLNISTSFAIVGNVSISFIHKKIHYLISISMRRRRMLIRMLKKYNQKNFFGIAKISSLPLTIQHHFGTLRLFTKDILDELEPGERYYLICGMHWDRDYNGKLSIVVLHYGVDFIDKNTVCELQGTMTSFYPKHDKYFRTDPYLYLNDKNEFVTKYKPTPVHIVVKWRHDFRPPPELILAKTLSEA